MDPDDDMRVIRTAANGGMRAKEQVFTNLDHYAPLVAELHASLLDAKYAFRDKHPEGADDPRLRVQYGRLIGLGRKVNSLLSQVAEVQGGTLDPRQLYDLRTFAGNPDKIVNQMLKRITTLQGSLKYQPDLADVLQDDLDLMHEELVKEVPEVAEALNVVTQWMEDRAEDWREEKERAQALVS